MSLDFTQLEDIATQTAKIDFREALDDEEGNYTLIGEKTATEQNKATHKLDKELQERDRLREAYHTYQENKDRAGSTRSDILKGIQCGEDIYSLFIKAIECISLMTGDTQILTQTKEDLKTIYGHGLGIQAPLEAELKETRDRLKRLEDSIAREEHTGQNKARLQNAINAHREQITTLEGILSRATTKDA